MRILPIALVIAAALAGASSAQEITTPVGTYVEKATGMTFPETVGDFRRVNVVRYKPDGTDESAGYNITVPGREVVMTIYLFPSSGLTSFGSPKSVVDDARATLCSQQFASIKGEIMGAHSDARLLEEGPAQIDQQGQSYTGHRATYALTMLQWFGRRQATRSEVYVFCFAADKWTVEYRVDYPDSFDGSAIVNSFLRDLRWTLTLRR